jgi:hypothetical protein
VTTHYPLPAADAAYLPDEAAFLTGEDAARFRDMFEPFVVAGGTHAPGAGLTHTPDPLTAYPAGIYTVETASLTYENAVTTWVICDAATTGNSGSYVRVPGTHYLTAISGVQPAVPATACPLMGVTTGGGSVTAVQDLRLLGPVQRLALRGVVFSGYYATLQEAIDALPTEGGTVFVEPGTYTLSTTLTLGNGSAAGASTRRGVALKGVAGGGTALSVLQWVGGAAPVVQVRGPLIGWTIENLYIDGAGVATVGVDVVSAKYGRLEHVEIHGCQVAGLRLTSVTTVSDAAISQHNHIANLFINAAGDAGIEVDGAAEATASMYNTFDTLNVNVTGNGIGLRLGCALNNTFTACRINDAGGATGSIHFAYDNGGSALRPAGNVFVNLETGGVPMTQSGDPTNGLPPNLMLGMSPAGLMVIPDIDGLALIFVEESTGDLYLLASQNPTNGIAPVGNVVVGQVTGQVRHFVPAIDGVASLGTPTLRWHRLHTTGGISTGIATVATSGTLNDGHHVVLVDAAAGSVDITLPPPVGITGTVYIVKKVDASANAVTVHTTGAETIDGAATTVLAAQWDAIHVVTDGLNWFIAGIGP